jgi:hypothetical protein
MCVTNKSKEQRQTTLVRLTGQKRTGAVQPPDAENRMSGGVEGHGAQSPLPHPILRQPEGWTTYGSLKPGRHTAG